MFRPEMARHGLHPWPHQLESNELVARERRPRASSLGFFVFFASAGLPGDKRFVRVSQVWRDPSLPEFMDFFLFQGLLRFFLKTT